jgi:hypothetical protein
VFPRARTEKMRDHERKSSRVDLYERETERDREFTSFFCSKKQMRREQREKRKTRRKT